MTPYDTVPQATLTHQHIQHLHLLVHLPSLSPHCSRSDESDSSVLAECVLDVTHTLLFYMFAKILVIPKLPVMELIMIGKSFLTLLSLFVLKISGLLCHA